MDPLHHGHIEHFRQAKALGDKLIVIIGNDQQIIRKYGYVLQPVHERVARLMRKAPFIDGVIVSIDRDNTQCETLRMLRPFMFVKGGDRNENNTPEAQVCREIGCHVFYGAGDKLGSTGVMRQRIERLAGVR
ncbi:adenylyltransferase/cytidyltransferase family protein [Patescibacteria group bacterium]|nr:adenylyltransferase/cytidyltransferase family protein [Patescibacteria group bacterium]